MMARGALLLACERFGIDAPLERAHFFAQCAHESAGFAVLVENLNYRAETLTRLWPKRFPPAIAQAYAHNPERIASRAYADRLGNGSEGSGEGWRYKGRGYIQLTGRDNYLQASLALFNDHRLLDHPELLEEPQAAALAAGWFWNAHHLGIHAAKDDLEGVTRGVNGGLTGLADRAKWLVKFKQEFQV